MKILLITLTILQSLLSTMEQKTLVSDITLTQTESNNTNNMPLTYTGTLTMRGKQFTLSILGLEAAYDGKTLYVYSEDTEEMTLSTPSDEELMQFIQEALQNRLPFYTRAKHTFNGEKLEDRRQIQQSVERLKELLKL